MFHNETSCNHLNWFLGLVVGLPSAQSMPKPQSLQCQSQGRIKWEDWVWKAIQHKPCAKLLCGSNGAAERHTTSTVNCFMHEPYCMLLIFFMTYFTMNRSVLFSPMTDVLEVQCKAVNNGVMVCFVCEIKIMTFILFFLKILIFLTIIYF